MTQTGIISIIIDRMFLDKVSNIFICLTILTQIMCCIYTEKNTKIGYKLNILLLYILSILLITSFYTKNLLMFYIFFEAIIIPLYIIIGIWGSRGRKIHAAYQFFWFTTISSLLILIGILYCLILNGNLEFKNFDYFKLNRTDQIIIFICFFGGFFSKIPTMPLHIWLPEAHVEAPTTGSVILAAVVLKLGFYGMYKTIPFLCETSTIELFKSFVLTIFLYSGIYAGLIAIRQIDLKKIIAYSSIVHMNLGMIGMFMEDSNGIFGTILVMLGHGFISAGLFFSIGFLYDRFHTRNIMYYGGLVQYMPIFGILFSILLISNMSLPGTCNFVAEWLILISIFKDTGYFTLIISAIILFLSGIFCINVLNKILYYQISGFLKNSLNDLSLSETAILLAMIFWIVLYGLKTEFLQKIL